MERSRVEFVSVSMIILNRERSRAGVRLGVVLIESRATRRCRGCEAQDEVVDLNAKRDLAGVISDVAHDPSGTRGQGVLDRALRQAGGFAISQRSVGTVLEPCSQGS